MRAPAPLGTLAALAAVLSTMNAGAGQPPRDGGTTRVSVSSLGTQGEDSSSEPSISGDGRYVAFSSGASTIVAADLNSKADIFVHDRQAWLTTRVSVSSTGEEANSYSSAPAISTDGRYVAFESFAGNLVAGDTNQGYDVFLRDRATARTTRVSVSSSGEQGNGDSFAPSLSADGRYIAFHSYSTNLVADDGTAYSDVFVHDRVTGQTTRVSVSSDGAEANGWSAGAAISGDGRSVAFSSAASNLVPGDTNGVEEIFVTDRATRRTVRAAVSSGGSQGNDWSGFPAISGDGRSVAFSSGASNLVPGDTNRQPDVFVRDFGTGRTTRVSLSSSGRQGTGGSFLPAISANGQYVAFASGAPNLVARDANRTWDVFVRDLRASSTSRVSVSSGGGDANGFSASRSISADGHSVVFDSTASNLVPNDTNGRGDVFVHDLVVRSTCPSGASERGRVSGPLHVLAEPASGPAEPALHQTSCRVADAGL
jgi:Tol biopolymer transport system component